MCGVTMEFLVALVSEEVAKTPTFRVLFRDQSLASQFVMALMHLEDKRHMYLNFSS